MAETATVTRVIYSPEIWKRVRDAIGWGNTGIVELLSCGTRVKKSSSPLANSEHDRSFQRDQIRREIEVYNHLPPHPCLLRVFHDHDTDHDEDASITLEYVPNGTLKDYLEKFSTTTAITTRQRIRWALEATQGVAMLHDHSVIHADLKPENMLLDNDLRVRIIDLSGCSIFGKPPLSLESTRFFLPRDWRYNPIPCSITTDLFALGSSIYQIATGQQPYEDLKDEQVEENYARQVFPNLEGVLFGKIIRKCWFCEFASAWAVLKALKAEVQDTFEDSEVFLQEFSIGTKSEHTDETSERRPWKEGEARGSISLIA